MTDPVEHSPHVHPQAQAHNEGDVSPSKSSLGDMDETSFSDHASSVDSMTTTSTIRPRAILDRSLEKVSFQYGHKTERPEKDGAEGSDTDSSMRGATTPRCGQSTSDYLCSGIGASSRGTEDTNIVDLDAEIEGMMPPPRTDSFASCDLRKSFHYFPSGPLSTLYGPWPITRKSHVFEQLGLNRRSSGSSTFTSEPPGLTDISRATTFSDQVALPFFEETANYLSESPAATPGFTQRMLEPKDSEEQISSQDHMRPPRVFTKEPMSYSRSPLSRSVDLRQIDPPEYDDFRDPRPPVSDSDESEEEDTAFRFKRPFLPPELEDDDEELYMSDSECSEQIDEIDESHPLFEIKEPVVKQMLREYREWTSSATNANGKTSTAGQGTNGNGHNDKTGQKRSCKRARNESNKGDNDNNEEEERDQDEPPQKRPTLSPAGNNDSSAPLLACPFAKNDHAKHDKCFSLLLKEIKHIKQHLRRSHRAPVYCPNCRNTFRDEDILAEHLRQLERCEKSNNPIPEGMTPAQERRLGPRVKASMSKKDQWFEIYDVLFPDGPRPRSPWVPAGLEPKIRGFVDMVNERGHAIIMENITQREELMQRLQGMGLHANQEEEQIIISLLSTSIFEGLQTITHDYMSTQTGNVPSLTGGETMQSSVQPTEEESPENDEQPPLAMAPIPTIRSEENPVFGDNITQDTGFGDSLVWLPSEESMQTSNINGDGWENIDAGCIDPNLTQNLDQQKWTETAMFESLIRSSGGRQERQS